MCALVTGVQTCALPIFHISIHAGLGGREVDLDVNALLAAALRCSLIPISVAALEGKDDGCGVTSSRLVHQKRYKFVFFKFPALCQRRGYALLFGSHTAPGGENGRTTGRERGGK